MTLEGFLMEPWKLLCKSETACDRLHTCHILNITLILNIHVGEEVVHVSSNISGSVQV
jgi:hypothetical protein